MGPPASAGAETAEAGETLPASMPADRKPSGWTLKGSARIQFDVAHLDAPDLVGVSVRRSEEKVRRARLGIRGTIPGGIGYKVEADFANDDITLTDAYLSTKVGKTTLIIGQQHNFEALDEMNSSFGGSFMERSAFTDAFGFNRRVGLALIHDTGDWHLAGGLFTDHVDDLGSDGSTGTSLDVRAVWTPKREETRFHLGASLHRRSNNEAGGNRTRIRQRPFVGVFDTRFIATPSFQSTGSLGAGVEAAMASGPWHAAAEFRLQGYERLGGRDPTFSGAYAEIGYFLTPGDTRPLSGGKFGSVTPKKPLGGGGFGAVQVNLRYDRLDLSDEDLIGGRQDLFAGSIIWTPIRQMRFLLNAAHIEYTDPALASIAGGDYSAKVVAFRAQLDY